MTNLQRTCSVVIALSAGVATSHADGPRSAARAREDAQSEDARSNDLSKGILQSRREAQATCDKITELATKRLTLVSEKAKALAEMRQGLFCTGCSRTRSDILANDGPPAVFPHPGQQIRAATQAELDAKGREFDSQIESLDREIRRLSELLDRQNRESRRLWNERWDAQNRSRRYYQEAEALTNREAFLRRLEQQKALEEARKRVLDDAWRRFNEQLSAWRREADERAADQVRHAEQQREKRRREELVERQRWQELRDSMAAAQADHEKREREVQDRQAKDNGVFPGAQSTSATTSTENTAPEIALPDQLAPSQEGLPTAAERVEAELRSLEQEVEGGFYAELSPSVATANDSAAVPPSPMADVEALLSSPPPDHSSIPADAPVAGAWDVAMEKVALLMTEARRAKRELVTGGTEILRDTVFDNYYSRLMSPQSSAEARSILSSAKEATRAFLSRKLQDFSDDLRTARMEQELGRELTPREKAEQTALWAHEGWRTPLPLPWKIKESIESRAQKVFTAIGLIADEADSRREPQLDDRGFMIEPARRD